MRVASSLHHASRMRTQCVVAMMFTAGCIDADGTGLATSSTEQGVTSSLIDQGFGFGGQATGGAAADGVYVVTSTAVKRIRTVIPDQRVVSAFTANRIADVCEARQRVGALGARDRVR